MNDVVQEDDHVGIHYDDVFATHRRVTADEAVARLTAGASGLALPGADPTGPLATGVSKLAAVLGVDAEQVFDVDLGAASTEVLDVLRRGVRDSRRVHPEYYRSEERRGGKACVSTCRSRWSTYHYKKNNNIYKG